MGKGNPNPTPRFQKGHKKVEGSGRKAGQINQITRDIKTIIRRAAEEVGFIRRVPALDAEGKPTGEMETRYGEGGELGYIKWLAENYPGHYAALYGRLIPFDVNQKVEEKTIVQYETLEERRAAMIAKGWAPSAVAALEEAMEPKFLRDMREESMREENEGQGEAN